MRNRIWWGIALCTLALFIAACGVSTSTASLGACPDTTTSPPTSTGGSVVITTDHSTYAGNGMVKVTIVNNLATSLYAWDHKTNCSILDLQVQTGVNWESVPANTAGCPLASVSVQRQIAPGKSYSASLHAGFLRPGVFLPGRYRLLLSYTTVRGTASPNDTIYSDVLTMTDCGIATPTGTSHGPGTGTVTTGAGTPLPAP